MNRISFFANTMEAAFAKARQEMGDDILLIESRRTGESRRSLGAFEVVVALDSPEATPAPSPVPAPTPVLIQERPHLLPVPSADPAWRDLLQEVSALRHQLSRVSTALSHSVEPLNTGRQALLNRLENAGTPPDVASRWLSEVESASPTLPLEAALRAHLRHAIPGPVPAAHVLAAVGPAGAGKTTALVKIAFRIGLAQGRRVRFISLDDTRIGAAEQLRACAAILGAEFLQPAPNQPLAPLATPTAGEVVLIDTPGLGAAEDQARLALAHTLASIPHLQVHLVLMASAGSADLRSAMQRWQSTNPANLLFTHLDDAAGFGPVVDLAAHSGLPLSFLSSGRRIPEDLETATPDHLIDLLLGKENQTCVAAA